MHLQNSLKHINHSIAQRTYFANLLIDDPTLIREIFQIAETIHTEVSFKALWALEFMCKSKPEAIIPYLDSFVTLLPIVYKDSGIRPLAKICEYLITNYYHQSPNEIQIALQKNHREQITEACFDWLITDQKVAAKAYALTCLQLLGTEFAWIHPELKNAIEKQYNSQSAAFKSRSRMVLKKIN